MEEGIVPVMPEGDFTESGERPRTRNGNTRFTANKIQVSMYSTVNGEGIQFLTEIRP
jgi:hypothetical protein